MKKRIVVNIMKFLNYKKYIYIKFKYSFRLIQNINNSFIILKSNKLSSIR